MRCNTISFCFRWMRCRLWYHEPEPANPSAPKPTASSFQHSIEFCLCFQDTLFGMRWNKRQDYQPPKYPKTDGQKQRIKKVLQRSFLFAHLDESDLEIIIDAMNEKIVEPKTRVIAQGDDGDFLFCVEHGKLDCFKRGVDGTERLVKTCESGDNFGELALLYNCPRAASVVAREQSVLWQLDRETFSRIVKDSAAKKRERFEPFKNPKKKQSNVFNRPISTPLNGHI